ncbi:hypothetical protein [Lichenicoccus sp.]|uniref:hypothetical protein n=1 Tax=Lichenicoccus sp. TaxID=2781899 RepID=UPI003D12664D
MTYPCRGLIATYCGNLLLLGLLALSRCAEAPHPAVIAVRAPATVAPVARLVVPGALDANGKPIPFNDPPAPPDTPLCGRQARETNAIGASLLAPRLAATGICASFTCYDPLTATYLGADGDRHVCR